MGESLLDRAMEFALAQLKEASGDIFSLPIPLQTVVVVDSAQGIIDNGGLEYFYESDFVGTPDYGFFVSAYRRIGAEAAASCIETTSALFPFDKPHLHEAKRLNWLDKVCGDESHPFVHLSRKVCGDQTVFQRLGQYVEANLDSFNLAGPSQSN
jgi:hypothetical protein